MKHIKMVMASSGLDLHGNVQDKQALVSIVDAINDDERVMRLGIEHNPYCVPQGKVVSASLSFDPKSGRAIVEGNAVAEDQPVIARDPDSNLALVAYLYNDYPSLFKRSKFNSWSETSSISVDPTSFSNQRDAVSFLGDCSSIDGLASGALLGRKSLVPDPVLQFLLSNPEAAFLLFWSSKWLLDRVFSFGTYVIDESIRRQGDRLVDFLEPMISQTIDRFFRKSRSKPQSPTTVVLTVPGDDIEITLLRQVSESTMRFPLDVAGLVAELEKYRGFIDVADQVTLSWSEERGWQLEHLATKGGHVLATEECVEFSIKESNRMNQASERLPEDERA